MPFPSLTPLHKALNDYVPWPPPFPLWFMLFDTLAGQETLISFLIGELCLVNMTFMALQLFHKLTHWARMDSWSFGNYRLESWMDSSAKPGFWCPKSDWEEGLEERHPQLHWYHQQAYKHTHCFLLKRKQVRNLTVPQSCYWSCLWKVPLGRSLSSCYVAGTFHDSFLSILTRLLGRALLPYLQMKRIEDREN